MAKGRKINGNCRYLARYLVTLGAGQTQKVSFQSFGSTMNQQIFNGILTGDIPLSFFGTVKYLDVCKDLHETRCSGEFDSPARTFRITDNYAD
jgi:hypothetical protein